MQPTELPLRDIHLPDAISWFPPALGWWLLAITLPLLVLFLVKYYQRLTRQTALKTAKKQLTEISTRSANNTEKLRELSVLLRRVAITLVPRHEVASLTGQAWLQFLDSSLKDAPFSSGAGRCLLDAPYRNSPLSDSELNTLLQLSAQWLKVQKAP
ncbi:MAG: DUF4381 domain-containing protein [Methylococcaceae bacterium]